MKGFGGEGHAQYLYCGDVITGVCLCPKSSRCIRSMHTFFAYQLFLNKEFLENVREALTRKRT